MVVHYQYVQLWGHSKCPFHYTEVLWGLAGSLHGEVLAVLALTDTIWHKNNSF